MQEREKILLGKKEKNEPPRRAQSTCLLPRLNSEKRRWVPHPHPCGDGRSFPGHTECSKSSIGRYVRGQALGEEFTE